ncbi:MAG: SDR family oxidoreductase [Deltaproteobacteria bacterium]|nr:SDR family oxidoreductase [Deltaproteobacteria bacterium]
MAERFEGKTIIVTGAAGGIGRATVERLAREGAQIVAVDLKQSQLDEALALATSAGVEAIAVGADVSDASDVQRYVDEAVTRFGGVDALFNNAGIEGSIVPMEEYPVDVFEKVMSVNVTGVFLGIKHVIPALRARGGGSIVNTSSVAGLTGNPVISAYVASKHAVIGLTRSAAQAYGAEGIRTNAVCPSPVETRMMRSLEKGISAENPEEVKQMMESRIPLGRYGTPEEVAALVAFLCSDDAKFINGGIYPIDGGMTSA